MKKLLLLLTILLATWSYGQIRYDDGPIYFGSKNFTIQGNKWNSNDLTYFIQNGTSDIAGTLENTAIVEAFEIWSCYTPLTFTQVNSASTADIVILWGTNNHGDDFPFDGSNGVLAHAFYPPPNGGAIAGDIHFDDDETWTDAIQTNSFQPIDLVTVAAHEIGHSLGLDHSTDTNALMYAFYTGSHRFLDIDDINGIQTIYGSNPIKNIELTVLDFLCLGSAYTVSIVQNCNTSLNASSWVVSNNLQINSSNQSTIDISPNLLGNNGEAGWVEATLSNGEVIREDFWIGEPRTYGLYFYSSGNFEISTHRWYQFTADHQNFNYPEHGKLSYEWQMPYVQFRFNPPRNKVISVYPTQEGVWPYKVRAKNICGCSDWITNYYTVEQELGDDDLYIGPAGND
ncbi:M10 family metallopeptidase domain-containing protein [Nonlabens sp.]|uniref:M10 family metallopeptidase domain-containing protein n=1 Tax=Nonlabens sp. TaxID=1888209 RepID=UPI001BD15773|nr:M10 family metallopeptidase domain-containing protein [Nonlabens sp.]